MRTHPIGRIAIKTFARLICLLSAVVFLPPGNAWAAVVSINCDTGGSINTALAGLDNEGPNTINVTGTCHENVLINNRERLTIETFSGATIVSPSPALNVIRILRSREIVLQGFVITGGQRGLLIQRSEVQVQFSTIQNNSGTGVVITQQSSLQFFSNVVQNNRGSGIGVSETSRLQTDGGNTIQNNGGDGVDVFNTSFGNILGDTIQNNSSAGVLAFHTSTFQLVGSTVVGNGSTGVQVQETSHAEIVGNIIRNNGAADPSAPGGVQIADGGEAFIEAGNDISGNTGPGVLVMTHGTLSSLGGNTITNNTAEGVNLRRQSVGQFFVTDTISGNGTSDLACDTTSLAAGDLTGVGNVNCKQIEREQGKPRPGHIFPPE